MAQRARTGQRDVCAVVAIARTFHAGQRSIAVGPEVKVDTLVRIARADDLRGRGQQLVLVQDHPDALV